MRPSTKLTMSLHSNPRVQAPDTGAVTPGPSQENPSWNIHEAMGRGASLAAMNMLREKPVDPLYPSSLL